jgi:RNA polymerase sigma-70 factor (ECF subfamily)
VSAANSALHRARAAIEHKVARRDPAAFAGAVGGAAAGAAAGAAIDEAVIARYVRALEDHDIAAMIELVHDDMHTTMPPSPTWIAGYAENVEFYRRMFARWDGVAIRAAPIGVNGGPGVAFHRDGELRAIEAIEVRDGKLLRMHHFMQPAVIAAFARAAR